MGEPALSQIGCPSGLSPVAEPESRADPAAFVRTDKQGRESIELLVQGAKCAGPSGQRRRYGATRRIRIGVGADPSPTLALPREGTVTGSMKIFCLSIDQTLTP